MYNRYVPGSGGYTRVTVAEPEDRPQPSPPPPQGPIQPPPRQEQAPRRPPRQGQGRSASSPVPGGQGLLDSLAAPLRLFAGEDKNAGIAGVLKALNLEELDSGDVLLLLIMLFLFLEGDNLELVITLALMLLLSLGEEKKMENGECRMENEPEKGEGP